MPYLKSNWLSQYHTDFLLCFLLERSFKFYFYIYIIVLAHGCVIVSTPLNQWRKYLFIELHFQLFQNYLLIFMWVYFCHFILFHYYVTIILSIPYYMITVALQKILKSGNVSPLILLSFFKIVLVIFSSAFPYKFRISL